VFKSHQNSINRPVAIVYIVLKSTSLMPRLLMEEDLVLEAGTKFES
jgi:hypothetical protein